MTNNSKDLPMSVLTGEAERAPRLDLNELVFDGKKGKFFYKDIKKGLVQIKEGKQGFEKTLIGEEATVIFIRIRRKLRAYRKDEKALTTIEHNTKFDKLILYGNPNIEISTNDELKAKYGVGVLKTVQVVYCLLIRENQDPELVRLIVKGSSLGSQSKGKDVHDFYSYVSSFKDKGQDLHFYDYFTRLYPVEESSDLGEYYAMSFSKEDELSDDMKETVKENAVMVYDYCKKYDEYYGKKTAGDLQKIEDKAREDDIPTVEYPEDDEELKAEDIPF